MFRATHLSDIMPSHASFLLHKDIISILAIMRQIYTMYTRYKYTSSTIKIICLLGKSSIGKKTPKEDRELGYSDFTLSLTFNLLHPQQKDIQMSQKHKRIKYNRVVIEANLRCKAPSINKLVVWCPETHSLYSLNTLISVLSINNTLSSASLNNHSTISISLLCLNNS